MTTEQQILKDFGAVLREKRMQKNLTPEQVSELAGVTDVYLRDLENGSYPATWSIWLKLCTVLNIDIPEIQQKIMSLLAS